MIPHWTNWIVLFFALAPLGCKHSVTAAAPTPIPTPTLPSIAAITPPSEPGPCDLPDITLRANPVVILPGNSATLTWSSIRAGNIVIQPDIGTVTPYGEKVVSPAGSTTYMARATNPCGTSVDTMRVTVTERAPDPRQVFLPDMVPIVGNGVSQPVPPVAPLQPIDFSFDSVEIRYDQDAKLQATALFLRMNPNAKLTIEGHADERGSEEYNLALGDRRANALRQYLRAFFIAFDRITTVSYGEERPVCNLATEDCYALNRRAILRLN